MTINDNSGETARTALEERPQEDTASGAERRRAQRVQARDVMIYYCLMRAV